MSSPHKKRRPSRGRRRAVVSEKNRCKRIERRRAQLGRMMVLPIIRHLNYQAMGRQIFRVEKLEEV